MNIVEIVEEQAHEQGSGKVVAVELEIGSSSGVIVEALKFALEEAVKSSVMQDATITINEIASLLKCDACGHEFEPEDIFTPCPSCGHLYSDVIRGDEMKIRKIVF